MTQEQEERFFKKINIDIISELENVSYHFPVNRKDFAGYFEDNYKKMFLALVEIAIHGEEMNNLCEMAGATIDICKEPIESASGLPLSEVRKIYEECIK
jgi:hypothetical protein